MTAVVDKLFKIIDCIADADADSLSLGALTQTTELPKPTLYRLLGDLVSLGILDHAPGGYSLGGKLFELGCNIPEYRSVRNAAYPYLQELTAISHESTHLAILRNREALYLDRIPGRFPVQLPTFVGSRQPLHCTALGKTLLAHAPGLWDDLLRSGLRPKTRHTIVLPRILLRQLGRVREEGLATDLEEFRLGVGCVAAPIWNAEGAVIAAISMSGDPRTKVTAGQHARVCQAAAQISHAYQRAVALSA